jgi:hypothetical protein
MATLIQKDHKIRVFLFNNHPFKSEIYEIDSNLIFDNEEFTEYEDLIDDPELITSLDVLDEKIYCKAFGLFVNSYGSIDEWGHKSYNIELQVVDSSGNIVLQSDGFESYSSMQG